MTLEQLIELEREATQGEFELFTPSVVGCDIADMAKYTRPADARLAVALRNAAPALFEFVEAVRRDIERTDPFNEDLGEADNALREALSEIEVPK